MNIDSHKMSNPLQGPLKPGAKKKSNSVNVASASELNEVFEGSGIQEVIQESLESMPEIRQHLVEVGRELAGDSNYPSAEDLDELSRLALGSFGQASEEER